MAESYREDILVQIVSVLGGLSGARHWGGAYLPAAPPLCERDYEEPLTFVRLPHLAVSEIDGSEFARPGDAQVSSGFGISGGVGYRDHVAVGVWGYVVATPGVRVGTWLQRLWWDVIVTLKANRTLGGRTNEIEFGRQALGIHHAQNGVAWFGQELSLIVDPVVIPVEV